EVRCSSRTPRRSSSCDTRLLSRDFGMFSARPAAEKPPCSTTAANRYRSLRSGTGIEATTFSTVNDAFEPRHLIETRLRTYCVVQPIEAGTRSCHELAAY